ncbi:MAG: hypothetical protein FWD74_05170 [Actinomycetia bacterium]|nr:hypothetical protein [Actinomycetes bacterium]
MSGTGRDERIGIRELRQNPAAMVAGIKRGKSYVLTEYNRDLATIAPIADTAATVGPKRTGPVDVSVFSRHELRTARSVDALLDDLAGDR